jgi:hypothetical protein
MRVTRRTRPSQIGFGASIGRRRLLHTHADRSPAAESRDLGSMAGLTMVVRLDFHDATESPGEPGRAPQVQDDRLQTQAPAAVALSARGS